MGIYILELCFASSKTFQNIRVCVCKSSSLGELNSVDISTLVKMKFYYRPQTKFAKVMFLHLSVSHFVHRVGGGSASGGRSSSGGSVSREGGLHPGGGQTPLPSATTGYGQRASGTHPTGIYSCLLKCKYTWSLYTYITGCRMLRQPW